MAARKLALAGVAARDIEWQVGENEPSLLGEISSIDALPDPPGDRVFRVPKAFIPLAQTVVCHRSDDRFSLLFRLLTRLEAEPNLLRIASDPDVSRAETMGKNVRRCSHKMKAFVRFRSTLDADGTERFVAWFEPEHHTVDFTAPFFVRRFAQMRWSILTPLRSAHWDGNALTIGDGASRDVAPNGDVNEDLWRTYFGAIFNPARLKVKAMSSEMPKRYWKNMPEAELIQPLINAAVDRTNGMVSAPSRAPARSTRVARERQAEATSVEALAADVSAIKSLSDLATAMRHCERCPLHRPATQVVPGEGSPNARLMFVGEQPGDKEDLAGRPFVGPAGALFDRALAEAGIDRSEIFVTNAVKHFKFEPRGKRRIHKNPSAREIDVCRTWLEAERRIVAPKLIVALGISAARALLGNPVSLKSVRGQPLVLPDGTAALITIHPSALLRMPDPTQKRTEYANFVTDLTLARKQLIGDDEDLLHS